MDDMGTVLLGGGSVLFRFSVRSGGSSTNAAADYLCKLGPGLCSGLFFFVVLSTPVMAATVVPAALPHRFVKVPLIESDAIHNATGTTLSYECGRPQATHQRGQPS